jgi:hypothetical protein
MKLPDNWIKENQKYSVGVNTLGLLGISLVWGHMLNLISLWFLPLTVFCVLAGYGSEVQAKKSTNINL